MANTALFKTKRGQSTPKADMLNEAGGKAYQFSDKHALAQLASTGCLNQTFYASASDQLDKVIDLCRTVDPKFIAQTALYARERGYMKDMPALLCAILSVKSMDYLKKIFPKVINNGKMLRNFVQIVRSDTVGRKSLGSAPQRLVRQWFANRSDEAIFRASIGNDPSLADVIKMVRPKADNAARNALYAYLLGKADYDSTELCDLVKLYELYKQDKEGNVPDVPFQMLDSLGIGEKEWTQIAKNAPWQMTRMNLRTFARHGVFKDATMAQVIADRLRDKNAIAKANVFPYQLLMAYSMCDENIPHEVQEALQDAMEVAIDNVPAVDGKVVVCPDVSGSMSMPATGYRKGATSKVSCVDVAALFAAAMLRVNRDATVMPFDTSLHMGKLNPRDTVMTNAQKLARFGGGGTNCSLPLQELNRKGETADLVVYVSDNESWVDSGRGYYNHGTETMTQWNTFKARNPKAKMVCIDIQAYDSTQAQERDDILNVGGFSDKVFDIVAEFSKDQLNPEHWVGVIEAIEI
jgi:60 kDa SS-A/Ro ribonucleoprotein